MTLEEIKAARDGVSGDMSYGGSAIKALDAAIDLIEHYERIIHSTIGGINSAMHAHVAGLKNLQASLHDALPRDTSAARLD